MEGGGRISFTRSAAGLLLGLAVAFSQTTPVRVAGLDPDSTSVGDGGPATSARLLYPISVAIDTSGNLYIADEGLLRIRKVRPDGIISTVAGTGEYRSDPDGSPGVSTAVWPYGLAVDSHGILYFSDSHTLVRKIAPDGTVVTVAGFSGSGPDGGDGGPATKAKISPWGIAVDGSNNVYIADQYSFRVRKVTPDGIIHTVAGTGQQGLYGEGGPVSQAQLVGPTRVAVDAAGNLYIADGQSGNRILRVGADGILRRIAGGGTTTLDGVPATSSFVSTYGGISVDAAGNVYTADWYRNTIRKITTDGIIHTIAGAALQQGSGDGCGNALAARFYAPEDVAADAAGNVYTGERGNPRVRLVSAAGSIRTVAGPGPARFSGDGGNANLAAIASPAGMVFDAAGNLYLADKDNNRIRLITPAGIITTIAGANGPTAGDDSGCPAQPGSLSAPTAVTVDPKGNVYIADTGNHRVMLSAPGAGLSTFAGTGTKGFSGDGGPAAAAMLNAPAGVAVDSSGNVYIADTGNNRLRVVGQDGTIHTVTAALAAPSGLAFDSDGALYIAEKQGYRLTRITPDGTTVRYAGTGVNTASVAPVPKPREELDDPVAVAVDPFRTVYVADLSGKLQRVTRNCAISKWAFGSVAGVASDAQGNIYYSDPQNNVVWRLPASPPPANEAATPLLAYAALVNAASLLTYDARFNSPLLPLTRIYGVAPGEMVRVRGVCLGPFDQTLAAYDSSGMLPRTLAGTSVTFDDTPAPLIAAQSGEIWAVVPSSVAGKTTSTVTVQFNGGKVQTGVQVLAAEPGIFVMDSAGSGLAAAINQDSTVNSPANPAARGSVVAFWATGQGSTTPPIVDGGAGPSDPLAVPTLPIAVTIGGQPAEVLAAALAPGLVGTMQVNVRVPAQLQPGIVSLTLSVGGVSHNLPPTNPYNGTQTATIAVK